MKIKNTFYNVFTCFIKKDYFKINARIISEIEVLKEAIEEFSKDPSFDMSFLTNVTKLSSLCEALGYHYHYRIDFYTTNKKDEI